MPTSMFVDSCGSTLGLFWLFGCALNVKLAVPGGVTEVPYGQIDVALRRHADEHAGLAAHHAVGRLELRRSCAPAASTARNSVS